MMTNAEVAALAAEIGNLCTDFATRWHELDCAREGLPEEELVHIDAEDQRIEDEHSRAFRAVFDKYLARRVEPALSFASPDGTRAMGVVDAQGKLWQIAVFSEHPETSLAAYNEVSNLREHQPFTLRPVFLGVE